ncbi:MAG: hypothetical protein ACKVS5_09870 [Parvularculaceae bacterium]
MRIDLGCAAGAATMLFALTSAGAQTQTPQGGAPEMAPSEELIKNDGAPAGEIAAGERQKDAVTDPRKQLETIDPRAVVKDRLQRRLNRATGTAMRSADAIKPNDDVKTTLREIRREALPEQQKVFHRAIVFEFAEGGARPLASYEVEGPAPTAANTVGDYAFSARSAQGPAVYGSFNDPLRGFSSYQVLPGEEVRIGHTETRYARALVTIPAPLDAVDVRIVELPKGRALSSEIDEKSFDDAVRRGRPVTVVQREQLLKLPLSRELILEKSEIYRPLDPSEIRPATTLNPELRRLEQIPLEQRPTDRQ